MNQNVSSHRSGVAQSEHLGVFLELHPQEQQQKQ